MEIRGVVRYPGVSWGDKTAPARAWEQGNSASAILFIQFQLELGTLRQLIEVAARLSRVHGRAVARAGAATQRQLQPVLAGYCWQGRSGGGIDLTG